MGTSDWISLESFRFWDEDDCEYDILSNVTSFIILTSGEGLNAFSINNRTNFFGEKKENEAFRGVFFKNMHKNFKLNLLLVLVLKSKALYLSIK